MTKNQCKAKNPTKCRYHGTTTYEVETPWGDVEEITISNNTINPQIQQIFRQGQCLALATELSKKFGTRKVLIHVRKEEDEELAWDHENNTLLLNENGEPYPQEINNIHHAYAVDKNNNYWDIDGKHSLEELQQKLDTENNYGLGDELQIMNTVEAQQNFSSFMSEQNYNFAHHITKIFSKTIHPE